MGVWVVEADGGVALIAGPGLGRWYNGHNTPGIDDQAVVLQDNPVGLHGDDPAGIDDRIDVLHHEFRDAWKYGASILELAVRVTGDGGVSGSDNGLGSRVSGRRSGDNRKPATAWVKRYSL
jgi:hypothetical protein